MNRYENIIVEALIGLREEGFIIQKDVKDINSLIQERINAENIKEDVRISLEKYENIFNGIKKLVK